MIKKILIANRGEIAVRIIRTCKEMGILSAAIYTDADEGWQHVKLADESYNIGSGPSSDSYLNAEKIIKLAKEINADAIHPGYGFFSENYEFIKKVEEEEIIFIGPSSDSVKMMGSKTAARQLMKKNNVSIVPGTTEPIKDVNEGKTIALEIGYPILLKAAAGGGGKGMRVINSENEFESSFEAVKREALKSFANDDVYIEKYILNPKHIEVQIFGDKHGNYVHVFERECSIQRRHQKIIEEAPSIFIDKETREKITTAAINAAKACNYYNAGTIELLVDKNKDYYFLEMNTRLQVEHPVSELISGKDFVKEQIRIAEGEKLSFCQEELNITGHALECRIYSEDSASFLPSTGKVFSFNPPGGNGIRIDCGIDKGSEVSIYYDPMIAKLISYGKDRNEAIVKMKRGLNEFHIAGVQTNIGFLQEILNNEKFYTGNYDINFIESEYNNSFNEPEDEETEKIISIFSALVKKRSHVIRSEKAVHSNNWEKQNYE